VNAIFTVIGVFSVLLIIAATMMLTRGSARSSLVDLGGAT
jgi:hypothetical protein